MIRLLVAVIICLLLMNCSSVKQIVDERTRESGVLINPSTARGPFSEVPGQYAVQKVFFSTNRNLTNEKSTDKWLGTDRSNLKYGVCEVSIPRDHKMGEVERPSIWRLELQEDPSKHVMLRKIVIEPKNKFYRNIKERLDLSSHKEAFVFIHGYNVSFTDAAFRTAQLSYDLGFDGVPVFYSWPSKQTYLGYSADEATIEWAQLYLEKFLTDFISQSGTQKVHLIAHSMGNRALTKALIAIINKRPAFKELISEVILTAPDIDVDVFREVIAPALVQTGEHITLYCSSVDQALLASKEFHGNVNRIGYIENGIVVTPGIDFIDATNVKTDFIGHSYFGESRSVLSDMFDLIRNHSKPDNRPGLKRVTLDREVYWMIKQ